MKKVAGGGRAATTLPSVEVHGTTARDAADATSAVRERESTIHVDPRMHPAHIATIDPKVEPRERDAPAALRPAAADPNPRIGFRENPTLDAEPPCFGSAWRERQTHSNHSGTKQDPHGSLRANKKHEPMPVHKQNTIKSYKVKGRDVLPPFA